MSPVIRSRVAIVTDSTAALPAQVVDYYRIRVVPLRLRIGSYETNEARAKPDEVASALRDDVPVSTAEPVSPEFYWAYQEASMTGHQEIISLHISSRLSATVASAKEAAARLSTPVHVVDSLTSGMSLGFLVVAAAEAATAGASAEQILRMVDQRRDLQRQMIYVDTLEYLRRGGRIGKAAALLGTALSIKPVLGLTDGEIVPLARVPGTQRALEKLVDVGVRQFQDAPIDAAIEYVDQPGRAAWVAREFQARVPRIRRMVTTRASAVISAHVGPGAIGLAVSRC